jgi:hypothetical protein
MINVAFAAGWTVEDAIAAIEELVVNHQLGILANKRTVRDRRSVVTRQS